MSGGLYPFTLRRVEGGAPQDLGPNRKTAETAGHSSHRIQTLESLNHLFQTSESGLPHEYSQIVETMVP